MTRQAFIRVLLSLLLLVSQQMASSHVMSHLATSIERPVATQSVADDGVLASAMAHEQSCSQCLAFAQLSGPLGVTPVTFAVPDHATAGLVPGDLHAGASRTILAFQSRAPPVLS
jgi:hypothetical protein